MNSLKTPLNEATVWKILESVEDPEIPVISVVDLGIIRRVRMEPGEVVVELMPTFLACPALEMMREAIEDRVGRLGPVRVEIVRDEAWSTERISDAGRSALRESGFAPPPRGRVAELPLFEVAECPCCGSRDTALESAFGPTPCRAIHHCRACRQPFEQFKTV